MPSLSVRIVLCAAVVTILTACADTSCYVGRDSDREPRMLVVSVALSLTEAMEAVAEQYQEASGVRVRVNAGASNALARQIIEGAAVDVFVSADEAQMDLVERANRLEPGTRIDFLGNELVLVAARGSGLELHAPGDLLAPRIRRIVIGDPAGVPAGVYARRYLESVNLWGPLESKLVPTASVRAALAAVVSTDADAGFVYRTDAARASVDVLFMVPPDPSAPIVYPPRS